LTRQETDGNASLNDPSSRSYFFAGKQMGEVSNNGTENIGYATWIANRTNVDGTGPFREGATTGAIFADFDQNYAAMNGGAQASAPGSYVVQAGDTLEGIAASLNYGSNYGSSLLNTLYLLLSVQVFAA
jgi:LysM repeat protein